MVELIALVAQYVLFAPSNSVLQVPPDAPLLEQPGLASEAEPDPLALPLESTVA